MNTEYYWHFTSDTLRNGEPIPAIGEWLEFDGPLRLCEWGLHASKHPFDALTYAFGYTLHRVELAGEIVRGPDKVVAERRRILQSVDCRRLVQGFARWCALQVVDNFDAPQVVREWLETGDESLRVAASDSAYAAYASACAAYSYSAAYAAASGWSAYSYSAAYAAASAANAYAYASAASAAASAANAAARAAAASDAVYREEFLRRVNAEFNIATKPNDER